MNSETFHALNEIISDLKKREFELNNLRIDNLRKANNSTSEQADADHWREVHRLTDKLEGLRIGISDVEAAMKRLSSSPQK